MNNETIIETRELDYGVFGFKKNFAGNIQHAFTKVNGIIELSENNLPVLKKDRKYKLDISFCCATNNVLYYHFVFFNHTNSTEFSFWNGLSSANNDGFMGQSSFSYIYIPDIDSEITFKCTTNTNFKAAPNGCLVITEIGNQVIIKN